MREIISIVLTVFVVGLLIFTSTAQALTIGIDNDVVETQGGETISFDALVDIHRDDLILEDINLTVSLTNEKGLPNYTCTFDLQGNELSACDNIDVALASQTTSSEVGYGYAFGFNGTENEAIEYGYGYGYGYAPGAGFDDFSEDLGETAEFIYTIEWTAPMKAIVDEDTEYTMSLVAHLDGEEIFTTEDNEDTVTVRPPAPIDQDADGVFDNVDMCPGTELDTQWDESSLGVNRHALLTGARDGGFIVFDTIVKNRGQSQLVQSDITTQDTMGCSCEQLLEKSPDEEKGLEKFGCPRGFLLGDS